jgi:hypothetical protein
LFELSFRDERYLPFEGAGAISEWRIELPPDCNAFDLDTVTDVVLRIAYTARDGGEPLRQAARRALRLPVEPRPDRPVSSPATRRLFSLKHEFAVEWFQFLQAPGPQVMRLDLALERFPYHVRGRTAIRVQRFDVFALPKGTGPLPSAEVSFTTPAGVELPPPPTVSRLAADPTLPNLAHAGVAVNAPLNSGNSYVWTFGLRGSRLIAEQLEDILLVCEFTT